MIRLTVSVFRKVGTPTFGSDGASIGIERELDTDLVANPAALAESIRRHLALCELAVNEEVIKLQKAPLAIPSVPRQPRQPVDGEPATAPARRAPAPPATEPAEAFDELQAEDDEDEDAPQNGSQLLGWARKQHADMKNWIIGYGNKCKFKGRVVEWSQSQVNRAYSAARAAQPQQR
jgi:hypothetical protein